MNSHNYPIFRDYLAVRILGTGQYSNVYLVFIKGNRMKQFAVKVFTQPRSPQNQMTINREVALLRKLTHRNIVKFVDYIDDHKICYIVQQYCDGDTLRGLITKRNKLDESVARLLTQQLLHGIEYLHSLAICHNDLKPENLLLIQVPPYHLKISDFGSSHDFSIANTVCQPAGTMHYMAPEKLMHREFGLMSDLWSFGLIIRECVTGKLIFAGNTDVQMKQKIMANFPIEDPTCTVLSDNCKDFMRSLLKYDPNRRLPLERVYVHPFVDMEHEICPNSYRKAKELIKKAINFDKSYEHSKSVPLYKEALLFLAAFVSVENNMEKRSFLNMKICEYERWIKILEKDISKKNKIAVQPLPNIKGAWYEMDESQPGTSTS